MAKFYITDKLEKEYKRRPRCIKNVNKRNKTKTYLVDTLDRNLFQYGQTVLL